MRIAMVAGEVSGDLLGGGLIRALRQHYPDARFEGIGGPLMEQAGLHSLYPMERLSVMGFVEVLGRLRELLAIRGELARRWRADPPDLFVGIDAPDFNLTLERRLKQAAIPTAHYVSPSVWAWRRRRLNKIASAVDLMLTLFPFEAQFYRQHGVPVRFVGHPLADMIPLDSDRKGARQALGLPPDATVVALLPGSRRSELRYLAAPFVATAAWCLARCPQLHFVVPLANAGTRAVFERAMAEYGGELPLTLLDGHSREAMAASEAVLLASGTAALEALLLRRPMVVAYKMSPLSYWLASRLLKVPYYSLPNNLAGAPLVQEITQDDAVPERLGPALLSLLDGQAGARMGEAFEAIHRELRRDASASAAQALVALLDGEIAHV